MKHTEDKILEMLEKNRRMTLFELALSFGVDGHPLIINQIEKALHHLASQGDVGMNITWEKKEETPF